MFLGRRLPAPGAQAWALTVNAADSTDARSPWCSCSSSVLKANVVCSKTQTASGFPAGMRNTRKWEGGRFSSVKLLTRQPQLKGKEDSFRGQTGYFRAVFLGSRKLLGKGMG